RQLRQTGQQEPLDVAARRQVAQAYQRVGERIQLRPRDLAGAVEEVVLAEEVVGQLFQPTSFFSSAWVAPLALQIASTSLAASEPTTSPSGRRSLPAALACFRLFDLAFLLVLIRVAMSKLPFLLQGFLTQDSPGLSQQGIILRSPQN